mgnify:CR=1 FL=1
MALFQRSERGIGRGEIAESQIEMPFFVAFMLCSVLGILVFHSMVENNSYTIALAISVIVFGTTILRVEFGLYILTIALLLSPEISAGNVGAQQERGVNLRYDDILIVIITLGVFVKQAFEGRLTLWRPNPINPGILAYLSICITSSLIALYNNVSAWDGLVAIFVILKMFQFYMIFSLVGLVVTNVKMLQHQLVVFFVVSAIVCIYGLFSIGTTYRVSTPFEAGGSEPNTLGGYLLIVITIASGLFAYAPKRGQRLLFACIMIIAFIPLLYTLSRATYVALFFSVSMVAFLSRRQIMIGAIVLVLFLAPVIMPKEVLYRFEYTFHDEGVPIQVGGRETSIKVDKSTYERVYVWEKVLWNLRVWPWFGGGVSWDTVLDSQYARVLIETGLLGFMAFMFLKYRMLKTAWESYRWNTYWVTKGLSLGMLATTLGLMVHCLGTISFLIVRIMGPFWFLMGLTIVSRQMALLAHEQRLKAYYETQQAEKEARIAEELEGNPAPQPLQLHS